MDSLEQYLEFTQKQIDKISFHKEPKNLYEPIDYLLQLEGKRIRPMLVLLGNQLFKGSISKAIDCAKAVEVFHNFTLMHDDIMDDADLRRGKITVHTKWNTDTAILSGDAMMIKAYQFLEELDGKTLKNVLPIFNKTAIEVCEGQQYDVDFEQKKSVNLDEYLKMITLKTSVLLAAAFKIGAITANASKKNQELIYNFGLHIGIAFQLLDDYLDVFGDITKVGKKKAGDILENKKTFLYIKARELANKDQLQLLDKWYATVENSELKINEVTSLFKELKADELILKNSKEYHNKAFEFIHKIKDLNPKILNVIQELTEQLLNRKH